MKVDKEKFQVYCTTSWKQHVMVESEFVLHYERVWAIFKYGIFLPLFNSGLGQKQPRWPHNVKIFQLQCPHVRDYVNIFGREKEYFDFVKVWYIDNNDET